MRFFEKRKAGFSLLEMLVVLAVLALTVATLTATDLGRSPSLELKAHISELHKEVASARSVAVVENIPHTIHLTAPTCSGSLTSLTFFADGTAQQADICLTVGTVEQHVRLDPLTAQLSLLDNK
ncbi:MULTISPECIES: pilus assembly FimT family protein [unclassified Yoonia]|uniref:pilus assembly FimT family protein n=1 Tax=unclassified Yoonia TaxID=2629118 RepID=UPI002B001499|nr:MULTISPECIES: prepilin-type N-terminal cleavage/methylation domain-containing protein [unclassified Yoonia]